MSEAQIAKMFLAMSPEDQEIFAAGLCSSLEGYYFTRDGSDQNMDEEHVLEAFTAWAKDELRSGDAI
ncbi:hypothetical protein [Pseudoruegeria sp. HB172150]|uniref:hypothetical protein n=1 Tax=Pseudoruegeria sp. HB172150 TaxID=2721164 RepID=UPI0015530E69|nr:hypothetical protein [Pseudoruegeria sp. HB172150]